MCRISTRDHFAPAPLQNLFIGLQFMGQQFSSHYTPIYEIQDQPRNVELRVPDVRRADTIDLDVIRRLTLVAFFLFKQFFSLSSSAFQDLDHTPFVKHDFRQQQNRGFYYGPLDQAGRPAGLGIMNFDQRDEQEIPRKMIKYLGQFKEGRMSGIGCAIYSDDQIYFGPWSDGSASINEGDCDYDWFGYYKEANGNEHYGEWNERQLKFGRVKTYGFAITRATYVYIGWLQRGYPHGFGIQRYLNGHEYVGNWSNGQFQGYGEYKFSNNCEYKGNFELGRFTGFGKMSQKFSDRTETYIGTYLSNMRHGFGRLETNSGDGNLQRTITIEGEFQEDQKKGLYSSMENNYVSWYSDDGQCLDKINEQTSFILELENHYLGQNYFQGQIDTLQKQEQENLQQKQNIEETVNGYDAQIQHIQDLVRLWPSLIDYMDYLQQNQANEQQIQQQNQANQ